MSDAKDSSSSAIASRNGTRCRTDAQYNRRRPAVTPVGRAGSGRRPSGADADVATGPGVRPGLPRPGRAASTARSSRPGRPPLDQSVDGRLDVRPGPAIPRPERGDARRRASPTTGRGRRASVDARRGRLGAGDADGPRRSPGTTTSAAWGPGYAAALGGELVSVARRRRTTRSSRASSALLDAAGVDHRPIRVAGRPADWTLLVTSGPFGDKLPVGFRGCHAARRVARSAAGRRRVRPAGRGVVAEPAGRGRRLRAPGRGVRVFAPAMRNMTDREVPGRAGSPSGSTSSAATAASGRAWTTASRSPGRSRSWP